MYERSYGSKYDALGGKYQPAAAIAKLMRADIKAALADGSLPGTMKNYSVRVQNYSGGRSIRIELQDMPELWTQCSEQWCNRMWCKSGGENKDHPSADFHDVLVPEGARVKKILQGIWDAYNHDGSEVQVDYFDRNYYGGVEIEDARSQAWRLSEKARLETRKAAREARKAVSV